jgi:hypothetical protein
MTIASIYIYIEPTLVFIGIGDKMAKTKTDAPKSRVGGPLGSKSKLPFVTFPEAIKYSELMWKQAQYNEMTFKDIKDWSNLHPQKALHPKSLLHLKSESCT